MELFVGCAMWAHQGWTAMAPARRRGRQLQAYRSWCNAVEGNTTFYADPTPEVVATWAEQTTDDFRFVFKLPRRITHERRLRVPADETHRFTELLAPLGRRAELLAVQLPASFGPAELPVLAAFLRDVPAGHRYAVELRHPAFFRSPELRASVTELLAAAGAEWTVFDTDVLFAAAPTSDAEREAWSNKPRLRARPTAIGPTPVVRYLGRDDEAATVAGWQRWIPVVARWLDEGRTPTVFVHTPDNLDAPALARRFHAEVAAAAPGLASLPDPYAEAPAFTATLFDEGPDSTSD